MTSVLLGRLPLSRTSEPYSLMPRAKDSAAPAKIAGESAGSTMRRNVARPLAPSAAAASSTSVSSSSSTGCTVRTTKGSVTNAMARKTALRVLLNSTPRGPSVP